MKQQEVVGLIGVKGAGKDTGAAILIKFLGFRRVAFADALYRETADSFGVTVDFLGNRDTKETPLPELALRNCTTPGFIDTAFAVAGEKGIELDLDTPLSPRWVLQRWGTEFRRIREGHDSYWLDRVDEVIAANPDTNFVVTDVRFKNEANYITAVRKGRLVRVRRPVLEAREAQDRIIKGTAAHVSEVELLTHPTDLEAINEEGRPEALANTLIGWYTGQKAA